MFLFPFSYAATEMQTISAQLEEKRVLSKCEYLEEKLKQLDPYPYDSTTVKYEYSIESFFEFSGGKDLELNLMATFMNQL